VSDADTLQDGRTVGMVGSGAPSRLRKSTHKASKGIPADWSDSNSEIHLTSGFVRFRRSSAYKGAPLQGGGRWFDPTSAHQQLQG
jgi:hypothetical protein